MDMFQIPFSDSKSELQIWFYYPSILQINGSLSNRFNVTRNFPRLGSQQRKAEHCGLKLV